MNQTQCSECDYITPIGSSKWAIRAHQARQHGGTVSLALRDFDQYREQYQAVRSFYIKDTPKLASLLFDIDVKIPRGVVIEWNKQIDSGAVVADPHMVQLAKTRREDRQQNMAMDLHESRMQTEMALHEKVKSMIPDLEQKHAAELVKSFGLITNYGAKQLGVVVEGTQINVGGNLNIVNAGKGKRNRPRAVIEAEVKLLGDSD